MTSKGSKTFLIGRDSKDGRLETVKHAQEHKRDHQVERMPKKGYGDTDRGKKQK